MQDYPDNQMRHYEYLRWHYTVSDFEDDNEGDDLIQMVNFNDIIFDNDLNNIYIDLIIPNLNY